MRVDRVPDQLVQRGRPIGSHSLAYVAKTSDDRYSQGKPVLRTNRMPLKAGVRQCEDARPWEKDDMLAANTESAPTGHQEEVLWP
jgi:hypothetical protein